jgi:hypothetical protein
VTHVILIGSGNHNEKPRLMITDTVPWFPTCYKLKMNSRGIMSYAERRRMMDWKKAIFVVMLGGMIVFSVAGCGQVEEAAPATEQPAPAVEQATPTPDGTTALPTDEGTVPAPPEGGPTGNMTGERPPAPVMDLATAAEKLGVTEEQLSEALGDLQPGFSDLAAAAEKLGVSEDSLREALGFPEGVPVGGPPQGGFPPGGSPPDGQEATMPGQ